MANTYTQAIEIQLKVDQLNRELRQIEDRLKKIQQVNVKITSVQAAATEAQKLQNNVQKGVSAVKKLEQGFRSVLTSALLMTGLFDKHLGSLEQELKVMKNIDGYFKNYTAGLRANTQSLNSIDRALRGVQNAWGKVTYDVDVYNRLATRQLELEKVRAVILRRQADALRLQNQEQDRLYNNVRRNVRTSAEARAEGSGFREFSQAAGGAVRRRVEADRQAETAAIEELNRLRETKALNSYNTAQRRKRYLAKLDRDRIDEYFKAELKRVRAVEDAEKAAARRSAKVRENLLLGAGFPLLFGGGAGAVGGGLLGSLFGDGFGGQIFLSALGTQLDQLSLFVQNLTKAFREGGDAAGFLEQALGYLDPASKTLISNLQQSGQTAAAAAQAQRVLAEEVGVAGANALRSAGENSDTYNRSLKKLALQFYASALAASQFFQNLRGPYGQLPGVARPIQEEDTTKAAQQRLAQLQDANALLKEQAALSAINRNENAEAYATQQKQTALKERDIALAQVKRDLDEGSIGLAERAAKNAAIEFKYDTAINNINTQLQEYKKRQAEDAAREAAETQKRLQQEQIKLAVLQAQVNLSDKLVALDTKLSIAKADNLESEVFKLNTLRIEAELEGAIAAIRAQGLSTEQETLQIRLAENKAETQLLQLDTQRTALMSQRLKSFEDTLANIQYEVDYENAITRELREQLEIREALRKAQKQEYTPDQINKIVTLTKERQKQGRPLQSYIIDAERQLNDLEKYAVAVSDGIGNAIANSMSQGIQGLIEGTKTAQQVFADFLKGVGEVLIQEGTRMIAMYIAIGIAKAFAGLGGGGKQDAPDIKGFSAYKISDQPLTLSDFPKFAEGGFVTGPTNALIGEGGEPEYVIPASKMRGAMNRYAAGARGSSVIPSGGEQGTGDGGTAVATPIDVRYTVERINSVDYVTADQFQAGMQQAAQQGAAQGEQRTLRRLQMSTSTRKRLGM